MTKYEKYFYVPYLALLIAGFVYLSFSQHGDMVVLMNQSHSDILDIIFKYGTYLGDGIGLGLVAVFLLVLKRRHGLIMVLIGLVQALVSWFLKHVVFDGTPRPKNYFQDLSEFYFVEGVKINGWNSFPSGHTMTAFSIATFLVLMLKKPNWSPILLFGAALAGLSRIYLFQHFLIDVLVGSLIGVILAVAGHRVFRTYLEG